MRQVSISRSSLSRILVGMGVLAALTFCPALASAETLVVTTDRAKIIRLPEKTKTVVVGNPLVADVTIGKDGLVVLTGKSFGTTNLIALDSDGAVLNESTIQVQQASENLMIVQRGLAHETYSCTPTCRPTIALGDDKDWFDVRMKQTDDRNKTATGK